MLPWSLDDLEHHPEKLEEIRANGVSESETLEFKQLMLFSSEDQKLELLKAVSAFANSFGGDLLFGVEAVAGIATGFPGMPRAEVDACKLRLESIVRDNLEPSLPTGCLTCAIVAIA